MGSLSPSYQPRARRLLSAGPGGALSDGSFQSGETPCGISHRALPVVRREGNQARPGNRMHVSTTAAVPMVVETTVVMNIGG